METTLILLLIASSAQTVYLVLDKVQHRRRKETLKAIGERLDALERRTKTEGLAEHREYLVELERIMALLSEKEERVKERINRVGAIEARRVVEAAHEYNTALLSDMRVLMAELRAFSEATQGAKDVPEEMVRHAEYTIKALQDLITKAKGPDHE